MKIVVCTTYRLRNTKL
uniref:Reverse transcriptase n=1 Tax=Triatoma infestans TaxID=30076 RepID=A0A161M252_TRIIF